MNIITLKKSRLLKAIIAVLLVVGLLFIASKSSTSDQNEIKDDTPHVQVNITKVP